MSRSCPRVVDAARLEVFRHRVSAVAEAMGAALQRAACSANIKERLDYSCAVFDRRARLLAQAAHIPVHLGAMPAAVLAAQRSVRRWAPGDVVALNDPFVGGSHLPDITTVSPVFDGAGRSVEAFVATRAHHTDVGGVAPGSMPLARDVFAEGLTIPPVHLVRAGTLSEDVLAIVCANSRTPVERAGDLHAQIAAQRIGAEMVRSLLERGTTTGFRAIGSDLLDYSARRAREQLARLRSGRYRFEDVLDDDGFGARDVRLRVAITIADGSLLADFTGSAPQREGGVNAPRAVTVSAVYYVVATLLDDTPLNAGTFASVRVRTPRRSIVSASRPAAVAAGNVETSQRIVDVLLGALAQAAPGRIPAASQGTMNNVAIGGIDVRTGRAFTYYETIAGGAGAGPECAGADAVQVHMTNTCNTPVEALETAFPLEVLAYRLRRHSAGNGTHRGGAGVERCIRCLVPARVCIVSERRTHAPWGLAGGGPGAVGENAHVSGSAVHVVPGKCCLDVAAGDEIRVRTPGGGGWGGTPAA